MSFNNSASHTNRVLSALAVAYQPRRVIGRNLLTRIDTLGEQSGTYKQRDKANMLRESNVEVGEHGMPAEVEAGYTDATFSCTNKSALAKVKANIAAQTDAPINLKSDAVKVAKTRLLVAEERRIATLFQTTANYAAANQVTLAGADQWSDPASTPIDDVNALIDEIYMSPDAKKVGWMGMSVWLVLKEHAQILERVKFGGGTASPAYVNQKALAELFGLDELYVGELKSTATNPGQTATYAHIWGKHFGICAVEPGASEMFLGFGARFVYQDEEVTEVFNPLPGLKGGWTMKVASSGQEKVVANDAGIIIANAVA